MKQVYNSCLLLLNGYVDQPGDLKVMSLLKSEVYNYLPFRCQNSF